MKTILKTVAAAAVALVGSVAMAQATYPSQYGACPNGMCGTKPGCVNGSCGVAGCPDGKCGPAGCPNGNCGVAGNHVRYNTVGSVARPVAPRTVGVGYAAPRTQPYYPAASTAACPNGNCPKVPHTHAVVSHTAGYRPVAAPAACPNGRCGTPAPVVRYPVSQAPRVNFLGMNW